MTTQYMLTTCALLGALSVASASSSGLRQGNSHRAEATDHFAAAQEADKELHHHSLLVHSPQSAEQQLTICNAYASQHSLDIVRVRSRQVLTESGPLAYKECKDFSVPLEEGDQLDFKAGSLDVGTFYATGLPKSAASLLLIPHRRSPHAVGVSFESHAFADLKSPQIAVIDAYKSKGNRQGGAVKIIESITDKDSKESQVEEDLKFNSVVAVNPGQYDISLSDAGAHVSKKVPLKANGASKYVVMRLGIEDDGTKGGSKYPQELVVFPQSGAQSLARLSFALVLAAVAFLGL